MTPMGTNDSIAISELASLRGISFGGYNVRSHFRKVEDIELIIGQSKIDCLCISETWLNSKIDDAQIMFDKYITVRSDRTSASKKKGGGGLVFC